MIDFIEGKLAAKAPSHVVINSGGLGYKGIISLATYDSLPGVGEQVRLWTHLQIREDEHTLFAFGSLEERWLFEHLISVQGVGAKLAITMLSSAKAESVRQAIVDGDSGRLQSIPKIGAKTAERIVLELKKKLGKAVPEFAMSETRTSQGDVREAIEALTALGFTRLEAERAVDLAIKRGADGAEELVKHSLRVG
ncbi:Holliday junction branch migration protein RuvA [candidate division KSB1 bacterium]|nr:Holliday junction branch migration protein RuvA [candidate division KSB1 bacterium]